MLKPASAGKHRSRGSLRVPQGGRQTRCGGIEKAAEQYPAAARAQNCFVSKYIMYSAPGLKNLHWRAKEANQKSFQTNKNCVGEDTNLQALFIARQLPLSPMRVLGRSACCADDTHFASRRVRAGRPLLPKVIRVTENFRSSMNHFDCARAHPFQSMDRAVLTMLTVVVGIFIVLSIGILVVHALDGFRSN